MMTTKKTINRFTSLITAIVMVFVLAAIPTGSSRAEDVSGNDLKAMSDELVSLINAARAKNGLEPVYAIPYLNDTAATRAREVMFNFSHQRGDGSSFSSIIDTNLIPFSLAFENIAAGGGYADEAMKQWESSDVHMETLLNAEATHIGVGCSYDPNSEFGYYWAVILVHCDRHFPDQYLPGNTNTTQDTNKRPMNELKEMANEMAFIVNQIRAENGLNPIYVVPYLCDVAMTRSREITGDFNHKRPDGSKFSTIIDEDLVPYGIIFENIAAGSDNATDTMEQWKGSPQHFGVILNPDVTHMGLGCAYEKNSEYEWYWQQTFVVCDQDLPGQYIPQEYEVIPQGEGDVTGDATVNSFDYLMLIDYLHKKKEGIPAYLNPAQIETADCFRDGIISEADAKAMIRYVLGEYKTLPYIF